MTILYVIIGIVVALLIAGIWIGAAAKIGDKLMMRAIENDIRLANQAPAGMVRPSELNAGDMIFTKEDILGTVEQVTQQGDRFYVRLDNRRTYIFAQGDLIERI